MQQSSVARLGVEVQPSAPHARARLDQESDVQVPREPPSTAGIALAPDLQHALSIHTCVSDSLFLHSPEYSIYGATAIFSGADLAYQNKRKQPMREHKEDRIHLLTAEVNEPIKVRFLAAHPVE